MASILVIDDEPHVRAALRGHLERNGHTVATAADGAEALAALGATHIDLVITDLYMPKMDGIELTIRLQERHPDVKVIAISGGGWTNNREALVLARRLGARKTLPKPFQQDELLQAVEQVLNG